MQTSKALIIGFDTPAIIQTSCEPLENLVATRAAQHSVHPTSGTLRVFKHFSWLEVDSVKTALSCPTHLRVTQTVGRAEGE
jgi:hypothetical protein